MWKSNKLHLFFKKTLKHKKKTIFYVLKNQCCCIAACKVANTKMVLSVAEFSILTPKNAKRLSLELCYFSKSAAEFNKAIWEKKVADLTPWSNLIINRLGLKKNTIQHLSFLIIGKKITIFVDHPTLTKIISRSRRSKASRRNFEAVKQFIT